MQVNADESLVNKIRINHGDTVTVTVNGRKKKCPWVNTYGDVPQRSLLLLKASTGFLEIAVNKGNAAKVLGLRRGSKVTIEKR